MVLSSFNKKGQLVRHSNKRCRLKTASANIQIYHRLISRNTKIRPEPCQGNILVCSYTEDDLQPKNMMYITKTQLMFILNDNYTQNVIHSNIGNSNFFITAKVNLIATLASQQIMIFCDIDTSTSRTDQMNSRNPSYCSNSSIRVPKLCE